MNRKKVLVGVGVVFAVLILIGLLLPLLVNVDKLRPQVQEQASKALGRNVTIGKLKLAVFSGGVTAKDISIADRSCVQPATVRHREVARCGCGPDAADLLEGASREHADARGTGDPPDPERQQMELLERRQQLCVGVREQARTSQRRA